MFRFEGGASNATSISYFVLSLKKQFLIYWYLNYFPGGRGGAVG
jgi:hypothetical protein